MSLGDLPWAAVVLTGLCAQGVVPAVHPGCTVLSILSSTVFGARSGCHGCHCCLISHCVGGGTDPQTCSFQGAAVWGRMNDCNVAASTALRASLARVPSPCG